MKRISEDESQLFAGNYTILEDCRCEELEEEVLRLKGELFHENSFSARHFRDKYRKALEEIKGWLDVDDRTIWNIIKEVLDESR